MLEGLVSSQVRDCTNAGECDRADLDEHVLERVLRHEDKEQSAEDEDDREQQTCSRVLAQATEDLSILVVEVFRVPLLELAAVEDYDEDGEGDGGDSEHNRRDVVDDVERCVPLETVRTHVRHLQSEADRDVQTALE